VSGRGTSCGVTPTLRFFQVFLSNDFHLPGLVTSLSRREERKGETNEVEAAKARSCPGVLSKSDQDSFSARFGIGYHYRLSKERAAIHGRKKKEGKKRGSISNFDGSLRPRRSGQPPPFPPKKRWKSQITKGKDPKAIREGKGVDFED